MMYTLGVVLLFDDKVNNDIRATELAIAEQTANTYGLRQPPHVTVKRPFVLPSASEVETFTAAVNNLATATEAMELTLEGVGAFREEVVYLPVTAKDQAQLTALSTRLIDLASNYQATVDQYEAQGPTFHVTVAMGLTADQHAATLKIVAAKRIALPVRITRLAVLLSADDGQNWSVFQTFPLGIG